MNSGYFHRLLINSIPLLQAVYANLKIWQANFLDMWISELVQVHLVGCAHKARIITAKHFKLIAKFPAF
jgi:hypothetical protein